MKRRVRALPLLLLGAAGAVALSGCRDRAAVAAPAPLYDEVPVQYPLELWDQGVEGETVVRVRVTAEGGVDSVEVSRSSGHAAFDSAAVKGARQLRYRPATRGDKPIRIWAEVPVLFTQSDPAAAGGSP